MHPKYISLPFRSVVSILLTAAASACSGGEQKSATVADTAGAAAAVVPNAVPRDTVPLAPGALRDGRSGMDQRSYAAAIRAGDASAAKWPTKVPWPCSRDFG